MVCLGKYLKAHLGVIKVLYYSYKYTVLLATTNHIAICEDAAVLDVKFYCTTTAEY